MLSISSQKSSGWWWWGGGGGYVNFCILLLFFCVFFLFQHRISTIRQYDRVMVFDSGFVLEFAPPLELLADPHSLFYSLANAGGDIGDTVTHKASAASSQNE